MLHYQAASIRGEGCHLEIVEFHQNHLKINAIIFDFQSINACFEYMFGKPCCEPIALCGLKRVGVVGGTEHHLKRLQVVGLCQCWTPSQ